jgi:dTDP-4-amino-4,6-dideoxygalactose transaminase
VTTNTGNTESVNGRVAATGKQSSTRGAASAKTGRKPVAVRVPLFRPTIRRRQMHAVLECLVSEEIGPGPIAGQLAGELAAALGCRGGVALADYGAAAAAALHLAVETAAGDETAPTGSPPPVLMSALVPVSYMYAARAAGLHPLLVDVDPETGCLDQDAMQRLLAQRPRALVIGHALAANESLDDVRAAGVPIVEDVSAALFGMIAGAAGAGPGRTAAAARAGGKARANGAANGAADESPASPPDTPAVREVAGDVLVVGLQAPGALVAGGGGVVVARTPSARRVLTGLGDRFGWAGLSDVSAALALAQLHDLAEGSRRCAELAARFRDAVARSRHRTLAPGAVPGPLFPVVVADGLRAVQRYAIRHHVETMLACEGAAITGLLPPDGDPVDGGPAPAAAPEPAPPAAPDAPAGAAVEERLTGAQELARRCLLFPLYPELPESQAAQVARVLATLP